MKQPSKSTGSRRVWVMVVVIGALGAVAFILHSRFRCCNETGQLTARSPLRDLKRAVSCGCFLGMTRQQIIDRLGDDAASSPLRPWALEYTIAQKDSFPPSDWQLLTFYFENDIVIEARLQGAD